MDTPNKALPGNIISANNVAVYLSGASGSDIKALVGVSKCLGLCLTSQCVQSGYGLGLPLHSQCFALPSSDTEEADAGLLMHFSLRAAKTQTTGK